MSFSKNFLWGCATASYQIEGAFMEGGRGLSIWDTFCQIPDAIANNENGNVACDHYHRFIEDITIMKDMGIKAYRFSIAWTRLFPNGDSVLNPEGVEFYDKLIDTLINAGIEPVITIFHWDLPETLQKKGGFEWDGISDTFALYAAECVRHFSPRVKMYCTINEPQCVVHLGYVTGVHAPGIKYPQEKTGHIMRNLLLCHGKAVKAMREAAPCNILIGTATTGTLSYPSSDMPEDIEMAKKLSFPVNGDGLAFSHNWFLDPAILGINNISYLDINEEDMSIIRQKVDFMGINIYNGMESDRNGYIKRYTGFPRTALGWPVTPKVMNYGLRFLYERYSLPIYVTENGVACNDRIYTDGFVHDTDRIDFMESYINEMKNAIEIGRAHV